MTIQGKQKLSPTQPFDEILEAVQPMITAIFSQLRIYKDFDNYRHIAAIAVWQAWQKADPSKGQFSAYIYTTVKGELLKELAKEKRYTEKITTVDYETLNYIYDALEEGNNQKNVMMVESILSQLQQVERSIILLYYIKGYSHQEIAKELGLSVAAVTKRRARIIKKLQKQFFIIE
ncbi:sigma-70 family RNA polymerase sigma factor [Lysinibacillus sp. FSL K6-0232]|uniref:RNA polymerase sigma factor n=1 Tax=unclassified Lysinibacillus TaxID=2636778 RepID=UPI0030F66D1D